MGCQVVTVDQQRKSSIDSHEAADNEARRILEAFQRCGEQRLELVGADVPPSDPDRGMVERSCFVSTNTGAYRYRYAH